MSTLSQFSGGMPVTKAIVNKVSSSGWDGIYYSGYPSLAMSAIGAKQVSSGAMTSATLKSIVSVTGRGVIDLFGVETVDGTSRTVRAKITIDGVVVFDSTSGTLNAIGCGGSFIGGGHTNGSTIFAVAPEPVYFNSSLLLEMASSLSETDKLLISYRYKTF